MTSLAKLRSQAESRDGEQMVGRGGESLGPPGYFPKDTGPSARDMGLAR